MRGAGGAGLVFVAVVLVANAVLTVAGFPAPTGGPLPEAYATGGATLRAVSALLPIAWAASVLFAAGVFTSLRGGRWALVGVAGVVGQSVTFAVVEALRLGIAAAPGAAGGLWAVCVALFGFNQVWLALALTGFALGGAPARLLALAGAGLLFASAITTTLGLETPAGLVGWLLWLVWITIASVRLLVAGRPHPAEARRPVRPR